jgi:transcription antitermination factor NusG
MRPEEDERTSESERRDCWFAIYTRHQHEKVIASMLSNKGFEVFLPLFIAGRQWKDRTKQLSVALFPTYVFLRGGFDRRLDVLKTPGVYGFVGWGGRPAAIPETEIDAVRRVVEVSLRIEPHPFLRCGDLVRIKCGPLMGVEGILVRKKNLFRLVLSVEMLGKSVAMEVDVDTVERVARRGPAFLGIASGLPENAASRAIAVNSGLP